MRDDENTYDVLEKIVNLSYLTTGNGFFLSQKGVEHALIVLLNQGLDRGDILGAYDKTRLVR